MGELPHYGNCKSPFPEFLSSLALGSNHSSEQFLSPKLKIAPSLNYRMSLTSA